MARYCCIKKNSHTMFGLGIIFISCTLWTNAECTGGEKEMKSLLENLFKDYDPLVRPSRNYSNATVVNLELHLTAVLGLDTKHQLLFIRAFLKISWKDELLHWDPSQNGGVERIFIPQNKIWKPELILNNAANENDKLGNDNVFVTVTSKGIVLWYPPFYLESTCKLDMSKYPFDVSVCPVEIVSWMYDNTTMSLHTSDRPIHLKSMLVNGEYEITPGGVETTSDEFDQMFFERTTFKIRLARRPAYLAISLLIPVNLLAVLSILSFIMPPDNPEKVNISVTILLSFTVLLTFIDGSIPPNSDNVCLLVIYISMLLMMSFLSVVGNILVVTTINWHVNTRKDCMRMCRYTSNIGQQTTARLICGCISPHYLTEENACDSKQAESIEKRMFVSENIKGTNQTSSSFSLKLNRAFFIISCILYVSISCLMFALIIE